MWPGLAASVSPRAYYKYRSTSPSLICMESSGDLVTLQILIQKVWGGAWESSFLTSSQELLLLLLGPDFEQQRSEVLKCHPWNNSRITWERVRNSNSQVHLRPTKSIPLGQGLAVCVVISLPRDSVANSHLTTMGLHDLYVSSLVNQPGYLRQL